MNVTVIRKDKGRGSQSELLGIVKQCRRAFAYTMLFSLIVNLLMLLPSIYSLQVLDRVISSRSIETLVMLTLIMVVALIFYGVFNAIRSFILDGVVEWLDHMLAPRLLSISVLKSSLALPSNAGQQQRDLATIKNFIQSGMIILLDAPWSIIYVFVIYMINPVLGTVSVVGAVVLLGFAIANEIATKTPLDDSQKNIIQSTALADIASRNAEAIEAMGMMPNILNNWVNFTKNGLLMQYLAVRRSQIIQSASRSFRMIIQIAITGFGGYLALHNDLTVGGMIAASILVGRALAPFDGAITVWKGLIAARDSYRRLEESIEHTPDLRGTMELPAPSGELRVENVYYSPPGGQPILKNVNFGLRPGETLGIIGPSGAGKSTLAKVIMGILPPSHGSIRLDGAETFKWNRQDFGQYVGYMPQHVDLFNGTIKDNIARMDQNAPNERVFKAAQLAGVHEMILRLPKGYETEYSQGNLSLSPGQRQRIGLARALYSEPKFLVLDEPNSNLDGEGERALLEALRRVRDLGITTIVVAHRPSIVSLLDKILMLRAGSVENFGPRAQILQQYTQQARASKESEQKTESAEDALNPENSGDDA